MLERLLRMPAARAILPFVRLAYTSPSNYSWWDDQGIRHNVTQAEGREQAFTLLHAIQGALEEVATMLLPGEQLCAFLDDVYALCSPDRVKPIYEALARALHRVAGIRLHQGKTRVWNKAGTQPEDVDTLGENVWQPGGVMVLGTRIGHEQFTRDKLHARVEEERRLWEAIPRVPDLQCAWLILLQSASPRSNHTLRTLPPALAAEYSHMHDEGIWTTVQSLLGEIPGSEAEVNDAKQVATLPMRMGGLG